MTATANPFIGQHVRHTSGQLGTITDVTVNAGRIMLFQVKHSTTGLHTDITRDQMAQHFRPVRVVDHADTDQAHEGRQAAHTLRELRQAYRRAEAELQAARTALKQAQRIEVAATDAAAEALAALTAAKLEQSREDEQHADTIVRVDEQPSRAETAMIYADRKHRSTDDRPRRSRTWLVNDLATYHGQPVVVTRTDTVEPHQVEVMHADRSRVVAHADDLTPRRRPRANADQAATKPEHRRAGQCRGCDKDAEGTAISTATKRRRQVCRGCASTGHYGLQLIAPATAVWVDPRTPEEIAQGEQMDRDDAAANAALYED